MSRKDRLKVEKGRLRAMVCDQFRFCAVPGSGVDTEMTQQFVVTVALGIQYLALLHKLQLMAEKHHHNTDHQGNKGGVKGHAQIGCDTGDITLDREMCLPQGKTSILFHSINEVLREKCRKSILEKY